MVVAVYIFVDYIGSYFIELIPEIMINKFAKLSQKNCLKRRLLSFSVVKFRNC